MSFEIRVHGARGSVPAPGPSTLRYGGHTTCLEVRLGDRHRLLLDCGSGLSSVEVPGKSAGDETSLQFDVLLTHYHLDHLIGLPFMQSIYDPRAQFVFHGPVLGDTHVEKALGELIRPPWFPTSFRETPSMKRFVDLSPDGCRIGGVEVRWASQPHPQGSVAYRLEYEGHVVVFATDVERGDPSADARLDAFAEGADILIHDAQYTPGEYAKHQGWGHSTWRQAVEAARNCGAKRLVLCHHDPDRTDDALDSIVLSASEEFEAVEAATEGTVLACD